MPNFTRRIGPIGTTARVLGAAILLYLALFDWTSWDVSWYDAALGLVLLPGTAIALGLAGRLRGVESIRFVGGGASMLNCAVIVALLVNPYTSAGTGLFYGAMLLVAAWRAQPDCEVTSLSNWILGRDDRIGCPVFTPVDEAEGRLDARRAARAGSTDSSAAISS